MRRDAIWALGMVQSTAIMSPLIDALQDEDRFNREQAAASLEGIGTRALAAVAAWRASQRGEQS